MAVILVILLALNFALFKIGGKYGNSRRIQPIKNRR
jgi:hypothetical protein